MIYLNKDIHIEVKRLNSMNEKDQTLDSLLELDGQKYVIDENLGLWVKFEVKRIKPTENRPHGIRYALTLHDRFNTRILGFDNAHGITYGGKTNVAPKRTYDHWHRSTQDEGRPYNYKNAGKLVENFWREVELYLEKIGGIKNEYH